MRSSFKVALTVLVVAALVVGGVALAQTDDEEAPPSQEIRGLSLLLGRLAPLVEEGVISQQQAEAVAEHLASGGGRGRGAIHHLFEEAADILNMTPGELRERMGDGSTLADIAGSQVAALIAELVEAAEDRIDSAFDESRITTEQRDRALSSLEDHVTRFVEEGGRGGGRPAGPGGHRGPGPHHVPGPGGPGAPGGGGA